MKKILLGLLLFVSIVGFSQKPIAKYENESFVINLTQEEQSEIFNKIKIEKEYVGSFLNSKIDDPEPTNPESFAYILLEGQNSRENTWLSAYFKLDKKITKAKVEYSLSITGKLEESSGTCAGVGCSSCKKLRGWLLGPVTGCSCSTPALPNGYCNHSTGNGPNWLQIVQFILSFLV